MGSIGRGGPPLSGSGDVLPLSLAGSGDALPAGDGVTMADPEDDGDTLPAQLGRRGRAGIGLGGLCAGCGGSSRRGTTGRGAAAGPTCLAGRDALGAAGAVEAGEGEETGGSEV